MSHELFHPTALIESIHIGSTTEACAFVHVLSEAKIGNNCKICDRAFIGNNVTIGDNVIVDVGAYLSCDMIVEDNVYIGPNVGFHKNRNITDTSNGFVSERTKVLFGASIGANVTIPCGTVIGTNSVILDGSVINADVPPNAIVSGNPAQITGYNKAGSPGTKISRVELNEATKVGATNIGVGNVAVHKLPKITDLRGSLTFSEYGNLLPFLVKRYFIIYDVLSDKIRGEHAHKELHEFLVCVKGRCDVVIDDGVNMKEVTLDTPQTGLHVTPGVWVVLYKFSQDAVLVVFASDEYDDKDYIRDYDVFLSHVRK